MWKLDKLKIVLFLMLLDLLVYYGDEELLILAGYPINSDEEQLLNNITLGVLLVLFSIAFFLANKSLNQELQQSKEDLQQSREELQLIFDNVNATIWSLDLVTHRLFVSAEAKRLFGISDHELIGTADYFKKFIHPEDTDPFTQSINELYASQLPIKHRFRIIDTNKTTKWVEESVTPIKNSTGDIIRLHGIVVDITNQIQAEEKIHYMAYHDALTGLPNRYMLNEYLQKSLERCTDNNKNLAIMFLDLDRFKYINDTKGHSFGDTLLRKVTERLRTMVGEGDIIARQGGDEFIILVEGADQPQMVELAHRIIESFTTPFMVEHEEVYTTSSIGISIYPQNGRHYEDLIKNADIALYLAKKHGKNNYQFYSSEPEHVMIRRVRLENGLRKALENQELVLYYQPQIELQTGGWKGVEALIRWKHPEFGLVSPGEFIPIAEETGLIVPIGKWVLDTACKQCKAWQEQGLSLLRVSVNVSALQFQDKNFISTVKQTLEKHQLSPELIELEVTESVMQDVQVSSKILHQLKEIGVKTSMDDFGTGYSSLNVLNQLPIDFVKIDKSFVDKIEVNPNTGALIKTMIEMGSNFKFELIAEGIEDQIQANFLTQNGCRFGQGYYYSRPLPADELEAFMRKPNIVA